MILGIIIWYLIGSIGLGLVVYKMYSKFTVKDLIICLIFGIGGPANLIVAAVHFYPYKKRKYEIRIKL